MDSKKEIIMAEKKYSIQDFLKKVEEEKQKSKTRLEATKNTDPEFYWSMVRTRAQQGLKTD